MAIPLSKPPTATGLQLNLLWPTPPVFKEPADNAAFSQWYFALQKQMNQQFTTLKTAIDNLNAPK